jgi:organic hydroperoxide reductase OsmC/OhrA
MERMSGPASEAPGKHVRISAAVRNAPSRHEVVVSTGSSTQSLTIPAKPSEQGSNVNGGEFLMLALATCYCNDLYREGARLRMPNESVEVEVSAEFPGIGLAATNIAYRAKASSPAAAADIAELLRATDAVAEIHNAVHAGVPVTLESARS